MDKGKVKATKYSRTKFRVTNPTKPNQVMLPDDMVTITPVYGTPDNTGPVRGEQGQPLTVNPNHPGCGHVVGNGNFSFSQFKTGFLSISPDGDSSIADVILVSESHHAGEEWELVL